MVGNKPLVQPYEKLAEKSKNNEYTTGDLLDFSNQQEYYKLTGIYVSRQKIQVFLYKLVLQEI